ncbi:MAG: sigma-54 interaction domain-containing protein [Thermodesulfobacteriota bacterium]
MTTSKQREKDETRQPAVDPTATILESISDGVFTVDGQWRITSFNRAAEEITGTDRAEAIGRPCSEVFRASMCEVDCALKKTMQSGEPVVDKAGFIVNAQGRRIPISVSTALLKDKDGEIIGGAETFRDLSLVEQLRKELKGRHRLGDLVTRSPEMRRIFDIVPQLAASGSTVLICGETGTGKELLARAIHNMSPRQHKPFVAVNCGALPDNLLESELFGYKAGAFTGAHRDKPGRFAMADGGTLMLDEIGEITQALQLRLLRVLQEKTFEPLGATKSKSVDVRVIAATNRDLADLVKRGDFRQDLYYRINVIQVDLPPLRSRKEDIPLLVAHFVERFNHIQGKCVSGVTPAAMSLLMAHDYPGNVRELENMIEHAFVLCNDGWIEPAHLPGEFANAAPPAGPEGGLKEAVASMEMQMIDDALKRNHYSRKAAARELGIDKSTLFRKMKALGLGFPKTDGRGEKSTP